MIDGLREAAERLAAADPHELADAESIRELHRLKAALDAVVCRAVAAFDARREWEADGAKTAAAWLATVCRLPKALAQREVHLGRALRAMPVVEEAWVASGISAEHVRALAAAQKATPVLFERDEAVLVDEAQKLRYSHFTRTLDYWRQNADPDGAEDDAAAKHAQRAVHLSQSFDGMFFGDIVLDPIGGTIVKTSLDAIEKELFDADWAEARERVGDDITVLDLKRTPAQRRADALVEMATRARSAAADARRPEPLFSVVVGYESFERLCELANGTVVSPGSLVPWLTQAWVERIVFSPASRKIDVGVAQRVFTGATRRAIEIRDCECFHPFCEEPAERCEIDHIEPYAAGGQTTTDNGRCACAFHNRARHRHRGPPAA